MTIECSSSEGTYSIRFQRANRGNALNAEVVEATLAAIDAACLDPSIHTIVLRSDGKHFCTGFDLSNIAEQSDGDLLQRFVRIETLLATLWHSPIRTVALASGRTWGAGADLFAACDIRVASAETTFRFPGASFGLVLGTRRLAARIGTDLARRCVTEGLTLDQRTAQAAGLVTEIVENDFDSWLSEHISIPITDRETISQLRSVTRHDHRDNDLAALVRSAARPGLRKRITTYLENTAKRK